MRSLYDRDFLGNGCPEEDFDPQYSFDDSTFTWATNVVMIGICTIAVLKLSLWPNVRTRAGEEDTQVPPGKTNIENEGNRTSRFYMIGFFATVGISMVAATLYHALIDSNQDDRIAILDGITYFSQGLTGMFLVLAALRMVSANVLVFRVAAFVCFAFAVVAVVNLYVLVLFFGAVELPFALVVYSLQAYRGANNKLSLQRNMNILKALGIVALLAAYVAYFLLYGPCGSEEAYQVCFEDCPFSDPSHFNHNGLAHVFYMIGLSLLAIAEDRLPSHALPDALPDAASSSEQSKDVSAEANENEIDREEEDSNKKENQSADFSA